MLIVTLEPGEIITAEAGAMTYMEPNIDVKTRKREKSLLGTLGLALLGRQSFFVNDYQMFNTRMNHKQAWKTGFFTNENQHFMSLKRDLMELVERRH